LEKIALVTGGKGYLGSHICKYLMNGGWKVIVYDLKEDFAHNYFHVMYSGSDIRDKTKLRDVFSKYKIDTVFHLAGRIEVGESMKYPTEFWDVNVGGTATILNVMSEYKVNKIIFSSTAAVYEPSKYSIVTLKEYDKLGNNSVYGNNKISCERMIQDSGFKYGIFRYFNLAGCDQECDIGENHDPETHLIPNIFRNMNNFIINGNDYNTSDGTCIRDYVHVTDVAHAHIVGADHISKNKSFILNLGTGKGTSILEIIKIVESVTNKNVKYKIGPKRQGDPDCLISDITLSKELLGYHPKYDIQSIVKTAYEWHLKQNKERI
jgi:UDP-glucose 4-epimerase